MSTGRHNGNSTSTGPKMCQNGCGLYGNLVLDGMCFRCFKASLEPRVEGPGSSSVELSIDDMDGAGNSHSLNNPTGPSSSRSKLTLSIPLRSMSDEVTAVSPAVSLVSNCSGRMTPITDISSPIGSPMLRRAPSRMGWVAPSAEPLSPAYGSDLRRFALNSGRQTPEVETRRYIDSISGRCSPDSAASNEAVRSSSPEYISDCDSKDTNKDYYAYDDKSAASYLGSNGILENTGSMSGSNCYRMRLDVENASHLAGFRNTHINIADEERVISPFGESTPDTNNVGLRIRLTPSTPDPWSPTSSPEPNLMQDYNSSYDNPLMNDFHNESDVDFVSDDYISYLNERRAADLEWIRSNPELYYRYLSDVDSDINDREFVVRNPNYITVTPEDYLRYLSSSEAAATRFDISPQELDELIANIDRVSDLHGPDYGMYSYSGYSLDRARVEYEPYNEEVFTGTSIAPGATPATGDEDKKEEEPKKNKKKRCHICRKKVGLTGFDCRCGGHYCSLHRYSDTHECTFDYKEHGQAKIRKDNPVIVGEKIRKI